MIYIIMAAGKGERWNNYLGIPKHLIKINGETLLGRTARLLKENNIDGYIITGNDDRYSQYGKLISQSNNDCEIDRFEEINEPVCYLYGDVYYTDEAIKTIVNTPVNDIIFFGSEDEIFAIKIEDLNLFYTNKHKVKELYLEGKINRCIGWEVYRSINNIPYEEHIITNKYIKILDGTDDIDYPNDYEKFKLKLEVKKMKNYIVKSTTVFDDYEGLEIKPENPKVRRNINDIFNVTKERYEHLKDLKLVELVGIEKKEEPKVEEPVVEEEKPKAPIKKTKKKK